MSDLLLVLAALAPAVALGAYVYKMDRVEKEPALLLLWLFLSGIAIIPFVMFFSTFLADFIEGIFIPLGTPNDIGVVELNHFLYIIYNALDNFIAVALVEEGFKWLALILITRKSKNFNCLFDGLIYAVFVSLGFAAAENVMYVTNYGWVNAVLRAFTAVPGHVFDGVIMGYFYSLWKIYSTADKYETKLQAKKPGTREALSGKSYLLMSILMPVLAHGFYDFACTMDGSYYMVVFLGFLISLYCYCFGKIREMSGNDASIRRLARKLFEQYHPQAENIEIEDTGKPTAEDVLEEMGKTPRLYTLPNGSTFFGMLKNGRPEGYGEYNFPDGAVYKGNFVAGNFHGEGTMTNPKGIKYCGEWQNGKMHGKGTLTLSGGREITAIWENGSPVKPCTQEAPVENKN